MNHVAITGASGFVGRHLVAALAAREDVAVHALSHRTPDENLPHSRNLQWFRGDLADAHALGDLFEPGSTLVNLFFPNAWPADRHLEATAALARTALERKISRVIHCSTAVVVGRTQSAVVTETTPARPQSNYEKIKLALEEHWRNCAKGNFDLAILRPTAVFGPNGKNLIKLADALTGGSRKLNYLRSSVYGKRRMNLVSVHNVVSAIELLADQHASLDGETFIASDDDDPDNNFQSVEALLAQSLGIAAHQAPPIPIPPVVLRVLLRIADPAKPNPFRVYESSRLSHRGWKKKFTVAQGIAEFAAWYLSARRSPGNLR